MIRYQTILLVGILLLSTVNLFAQAPLGINYQGVARSSDGSPIINQIIGLKVSITNGPNGSADYVEEHHPETNEFGLFTVVVGQGQSAGRISDVDWAGGNKWLQIEVDPSDKSNYLLVGSQQMMSVPYALYAASSGESLQPGFGIDINNGQVNNLLPDKVVSITGSGSAVVTGTYPNFTINAVDNINDADANPANELQLLTKTGNTISLSSGGGSVIDDVDDADADATNEFNTGGAYITNNTLRITDAGGNTDIPLGTLNANLNANNNRITNLANPTLGQDAATKNYVDAQDALDLDKSATNEFNTGATYQANNTLRITDLGGNVDVALGTLNADLNANNNNINNLADPVNPQDAVNLRYLEAKDATDYAIDVPVNYTSPGLGDIALDLSASAILDKGGLISGSTITITEAGVYSVSVQGVSADGISPSQIDIVVNGVSTRVIMKNGFYLGQYLFDLFVNDTIQIIVRFNDAENVILQIAVYKI